MNLNAYKDSLRKDQPPTDLSQVLTGLWYDAKDNWEKAHDLIDGCEEAGGSWAHAYLHRKEGDLWNADYWYRRAGKDRPQYGLDEEWEVIVSFLLST